MGYQYDRASLNASKFSPHIPQAFPAIYASRSAANGFLQLETLCKRRLK
jgi:hypothetical protein